MIYGIFFLGKKKVGTQGLEKEAKFLVRDWGIVFSGIGLLYWPARLQYTGWRAGTTTYARVDYIPQSVN
jgi:hypothetical protein